MNTAVFANESAIRSQLPEMVRIVKKVRQTNGRSYYLIEWLGNDGNPLVRSEVRRRIRELGKEYLGKYFLGLKVTGENTLELIVRIGTRASLGDQWWEFCGRVKIEVSASRRKTIGEFWSELCRKLKNLI